MNRKQFKKSKEELQDYLMFKHRGSRIESKKHYRRKEKHTKKENIE